MTETPSFECGKFYPGQGPGNRRDYDPPIDPKRHPRRKRAEPWGPIGPDRPTGEVLVKKTCWLCLKEITSNYQCNRDGSANPNGNCLCTKDEYFCVPTNYWVPQSLINSGWTCPPPAHNTLGLCELNCEDIVTSIYCPPDERCNWFVCCEKKYQWGEKYVPCVGPQLQPNCRCAVLAERDCKFVQTDRNPITGECAPPNFDSNACPAGFQIRNFSFNNQQACLGCVNELGEPLCPPPRIPREGGPEERVPPTQACPDRTCYFCERREIPSGQITKYPCPDNPNCLCFVSRDAEIKTINQVSLGFNVFGNCVYPPITESGEFYGCGPQASLDAAAECTRTISRDCSNREPVGPMTRANPVPTGPGGGPTGPGPQTGPILDTGPRTQPLQVKTCYFCKETQSTGVTVDCQGPQGQLCKCNLLRRRECIPVQVQRRPDGQFPPCSTVIPAGVIINFAPYNNCGNCTDLLGPPICETDRSSNPRQTDPDTGPATPKTYYRCVAGRGCRTVLLLPDQVTSSDFISLQDCSDFCDRTQIDPTSTNPTSPNQPESLSTFFKCNRNTGICTTVITTPSQARREGYFTTKQRCELACRANTADADRLSRNTLGSIDTITGSLGEGTANPTELRSYYRCVNGTCVSRLATPLEATDPSFHTTLQNCLNYCKVNGPASITRLGSAIKTEPTILDTGGSEDGPISFERFNTVDPFGRQVIPEPNTTEPIRISPADVNIGDRPYYELPENSVPLTVNLDPLASIYLPPVREYENAVVRNTKESDLFGEYIHEAIAYFLDKSNTSDDWRSYYSADLTLKNIEQSLKPKVISIFENITDQKGMLIGKEYFIEVIKNKLIKGTIDDFNLNYYKQLAEKKYRSIPTPEKTGDKRINTLRAFAYLENHLIPLEPNKSEARTNKLVPLIKTFATDLEKSIPVIIDGVETKYYINDDDIVVGRANLKITDGDYVTVGIGDNIKRIYLNTERDHAYLIRDIDKEIALNLLDGDTSIRLSVSSPYSSNIEFNYSLSGERENVYFLKLVTESVETKRINEFLDNTKVRYDLCSISTQQDLDDINEYVKFKLNHYLFPVNPNDVFIDYMVSSGHIYLEQQDVRFDGHARKTNKQVPLLVRQIPWYILIYPTNKEQNNPFDIESELVEFNPAGNTVREISYEMSIDKLEFDPTLSIPKYIDVNTIYPDRDILNEYNIDSRKVTFNPDNEFFRSGYKNSEKTTTRTKTPLRKIKEIITELNNNYVLDRGLTTFDIFSRLSFTDYNKFTSTVTNKVIFDTLKEGAINNVKIYEVTKYSGDAYLNKTALIKRRAAATPDTYTQIRGLNTGEFIEPPTQTEPPKIITSSTKRIKPLQ